MSSSAVQIFKSVVQEERGKEEKLKVKARNSLAKGGGA
jgi:hypothetical protein